MTHCLILSQTSPPSSSTSKMLLLLSIQKAHVTARTHSKESYTCYFFQSSNNNTVNANMWLELPRRSETPPIPYTKYTGKSGNMFITRWGSRVSLNGWAPPGGFRVVRYSRLLQWVIIWIPSDWIRALWFSSYYEENDGFFCLSLFFFFPFSLWCFLVLSSLLQCLALASLS